MCAHSLGKMVEKASVNANKDEFNNYSTDHCGLHKENLLNWSLSSIYRSWSVTDCVGFILCPLPTCACLPVGRHNLQLFSCAPPNGLLVTFLSFSYLFVSQRGSSTTLLLWTKKLFRRLSCVVWKFHAMAKKQGGRWKREGRKILLQYFSSPVKGGPCIRIIHRDYWWRQGDSNPGHCG